MYIYVQEWKLYTVSINTYYHLLSIYIIYIYCQMLSPFFVAGLGESFWQSLRNTDAWNSSSAQESRKSLRSNNRVFSITVFVHCFHHRWWQPSFKCRQMKFGENAQCISSPFLTCNWKNTCSTLGSTDILQQMHRKLISLPTKGTFSALLTNGPGAR